MSSNRNGATEFPNKPEETMERRLAAHIATQAFQLLVRSNMLRDEHSDAPLIYAWPRADRVILIVDPLRLKNIDGVISHRFRHHLGTILQGRRVVTTNHRGIFLQVAYWPEPARPLMVRDLDLSAQPTPLHVPIGVTASGDLWLSLAELDAVLIGGSRRMGKTNLLHGWIQALLQGGETRLDLFDGKGVEFERYHGAPRVQVIAGELGPGLGEIFTQMMQRLSLLKAAGARNLVDYNTGRSAGERLERIVLIVDELAFALKEDGVESLLVDLAARGGAVGIHPILATQRPGADVVTPNLKANLVTRIALAVPARADSMVILDRPGAERLAKDPGRLMITWKARLIEAQGFRTPETLPREIVEAGLPETSAALERLSERELLIAHAALQRGSWFKIRELKQDTGESADYLIGLARKWELLRWLTPVQRNERGHNLGRQLTPVFRQLLGEQGEQANVGNEAIQA